MSWYRDTAAPTLDWKYRAAVTVRHTSATTTDVEVAIPVDLDVFWDNIQADGDDIRVTTADGLTLATYQFKAGYNLSNRSLTLELDNVVVVNGTTQFYLYWGNSTASSAAGSFVASAAITTTTIERAIPCAPVFKYRAQRPGDTRPMERISKTSTDTLTVWLDLRDTLMQRSAPFKNSRFYEEIASVTYSVYDYAGGVPVDETTMYDASKTVLIDGFVGVQLKAGSDGDDVTLQINVTTTKDRVLQFRAWVQVRDVDEVG